MGRTNKGQAFRRRGLLTALAAIGVLASGRGAAAQPEQVYDGITVAVESGTLFLPVREIGEGLDWPARWDPGKRTAYLKDRPMSELKTRHLLEGTLLVALRDLTKLGADVRWDGARNMARVTAGNREFRVRAGAKRVAVSIGDQRLRAWQGNRLVLDSRISSGIDGHRTPRGSFTAGPYKARMHRSSLYNNAPMPYSVQVTGNIFVHGFHTVPYQRASRGCIRLPLNDGNPARWFYEWIDVGTPVTVGDRLPE